MGHRMEVEHNNHELHIQDGSHIHWTWSVEPRSKAAVSGTKPKPEPELNVPTGL